MRAYEATHRNRRTILGKIEQLASPGALMEAARDATPADVQRLVELAQELRAELRVMRGGALWELRESTVRATAEFFALMLDAQ